MSNAGGGSNVVSAILKEYSQLISIDHSFEIAASILICGVTLVCWMCTSCRSGAGDFADDDSGFKEADIQSLQTEDPSDDSGSDDDEYDDNKSEQSSSSSASSSSSTAAAYPNTLHRPITKSTREKARAQGLVLYNKQWYKRGVPSPSLSASRIKMARRQCSRLKSRQRWPKFSSE